MGNLCSLQCDCCITTNSEFTSQKWIRFLGLIGFLRYHKKESIHNNSQPKVTPSHHVEIRRLPTRKHHVATTPRVRREAKVATASAASPCPLLRSIFEELGKRRFQRFGGLRIHGLISHRKNGDSWPYLSPYCLLIGDSRIHGILNHL